VSRLSLALEAGIVTLPDEGAVLVINPTAEADLSALPKDRVTIVQGFYPDNRAWTARGFQTVPEMPETAAAAAVLYLPRAKAQARANLAAATATGATVIVDGAKSSGIDSFFKAARTQSDTTAAYSKAHGKVFQIAPTTAFSDWALPNLQSNANGWTTAPGVFSADGPDPASEALANGMPPLKGRVADLGAGWGYLTKCVLEKSEKITVLDAIEAEYSATRAFSKNVDDPRARIHWADATQWSEDGYDHIICNPPFHVSGRADPAIGRHFIDAAQRMLRPSGTFWLVANRHLPYESALTTHFADVTEIEGSPAFKLFCVRKPKRGPRQG
jgi:16S rRNA (guanine1207-N2)-methyltransferase